MLELNDIVFGYGDSKIIDGISLFIAENQKFIIEGDNGSGKTTLFKLILGFLVPDEGDIKINTDKIGYVSQINIKKQDRFPVSVFELLAFRLQDTHLLNINRRRNSVMEALERVNMDKYIDAPISTLSGGQFQRVMIARELIIEPELLLLDEPTNALDINAKKSLYKLLYELEIAVGLITHEAIDLDFTKFKLEKGKLKEVV